METQVSIVDVFILKSKYTMLWWWATTRIPFVTEVSDIGNVVRMRPKSNVKLTYMILRLEACVTILESLYVCDSNFTPLGSHDSWASLCFPLLCFPSPPKQASSTPPPHQPCKVESRDMTCFNPVTWHSTVIGCPFHGWMDGWMWWPTFHIRTMGAPMLTSSLNMLQEIGGWGSLRFPFRNNIYHNPGEYSKLWVVIHFMVVVKVVIIEV